MRIVVLPPYCASQDTKLIHWQYTLPFLLKDQLRQVKDLRILPDGSLEFAGDDSVDFGNKELASRPVSGLAGVIEIGRAIEARKLVWSSFELQGSDIAWSALVVDVRTGRTSDKLTASSTNCWNVVCQMRGLVLREIGVHPAAAERRRMDRPLTTSSAALELVSRALYDKNEGRPVSNVVETLRQAVRLDPDFAIAKEALVVMLVTGANLDEASNLISRSVEANPTSARGHYLWGAVLLAQNLNALAREQFLLVEEQDPGVPLPLIRLAECCGRRAGKWGEAIPLLAKAERLEPYSALIHEELGTAYAHLGQWDSAASELQISERYDTGMDGLVAVRLGEAYTLLGDAPRAVAQYETFLSGAAKIRVRSPLVQGIEAALADQKLRLSPHAVKASMPRTFNAQQLQSALEATLTPTELTVVTNPFGVTAEMTKWAKGMAGDRTGDINKARVLFSGLSRRIDLTPHPERRTAEEAFREWRDPKASLTCQDYALLFVALARQLDLKAFYVHVKRDYRSNLVAHACAGVFVNGEALLVDPAYHWLGIPHKDYEVLTDPEAIGLWLSQSRDLAQQQCAVKLLPRRALPRFALAINLSLAGKPQEARQALQAGLQLDSGDWLSFLARGIVENYSGNSQEAVKHLQECLGLCPSYPEVHYYLAQAYQMQGMLQNALEEYRAFLNQQGDPGLAERAREEVARLDTSLDENTDGSGALAPR
jgi:tetratricopeptide (TPR) repeat protein